LFKTARLAVDDERMTRWRHVPACGVVIALLCTPAPALAAPTVSEYPISPGTNRGPLGVVAGPDGAVWFTESKGALLSPPGIGRITASGEISEYNSGLLAAPTASITLGPDGNLWFTEPSSHTIGRITPSGTITEFFISGSSQPQGIVAGPDGNLWFTQEAGHGSIGRITTSGEVSEFEAGLTSGSKPLGIAAGSDGALWFTEFGSGGIGRITTSGTISQYTSGLSGGSKPTGIAEGPDGALWFTESGGPGAIGRITTSGVISQYTSGLTGGSEPSEITAASDGNLYFTETKDPGAIGEITPSGIISQVAIHTTNSKPQGIAAGPDGNVWFTESADPGTIGKLTLPPQVGALSPSGVSEQTATLNATVAPKSQLTSYYFEYGPTESYGEHTPETSAGAGAAATSVSSTIGSLSATTTYHYRVVATNATGTIVGSDETFTTITPPVVLTGPAAGVDLTGGTLTGSVNPESQSTSYRFQWGTSTSYGNETGDASAGSDSVEHPVSESLTELTPNTIYHFRVVASNCGWCGEGTTYGPDETFRTAVEPPTAMTSAARALTQTTATLTGSVDPNGAATSYRFEWGQSAFYDHRTPLEDSAVGEDSGEHLLERELDGLTPDTTYHYRIVATNCEGCAAGTTYGADQSFQTEAPIVPEASPSDPLRSGLLVSSPILAPSSLAPTTLFQGDPAPDRPVLGRRVILREVSGNVLVKLPGTATFRALSSAADIPMGSVIDAEHGRLLLIAARDLSGRVQTVTVWGARFRVSQRKARGGHTTLALIGGRPYGCPSSRAGGSTRTSTVAKASAAKAGARRGKALWAKDNHGHFSTRGNNSVATVRGTYWGTAETCAGTLTIVRQGEVRVRPRHGRPVLVRAGHSYLAKG
jgi:streptogramin lyase